MTTQTIPQVGLLDFGALPPEVNSGLMYAGAGAGPLVAAAAAWADLADELASAAHACSEVLSTLTGTEWRGPAATSMIAAATPYTGWMQATAGHAAHAAGQAAAAVGAYEAAYAATVPPPVIAGNRARQAVLVATNLLGQNTPAIAATEAAYTEMWAQDAAAMYRYAGDAAVATTLKPLTEPPATTTASASAGQSAASAQATASTAGSTSTNLSQLLSGLGLNITAPNSGNSTSGLNGLLNFISGSSGATPFSNFLNSTVVNSAIAGAPYSPAFIGQVVGDMTAMETVLGRTLSPAAALPGLSSATSSVGAAGTGVGGMGTLTGATHVAAAEAGAAGSGVSAGVGKATLVRALSVPPNWAAVAAPAEVVAAPVSALPSGLPTASPVITAGMPGAAASTASRMVDKAEDEEEDAPVYGMPTKALVRTPVGG